MSGKLTTPHRHPWNLPDSDNDARLLMLLADARAAEVASAAACEADNDAAAMDALSELEDTLAAIAATPAAGWLGVAAKAARLCRSLAADDGFGDTIDLADVPIVRSLAADIARLAPDIKA